MILVAARPGGGGGGEKRKLPRWAAAIAARRRELGKTQEDLAFETGLSQSLISQIERGVHHPLRLTAENFHALLKALQWGLHSFSEATGIEVPVERFAYADIAPASIRFVPILGGTMAGKPFEYPIPREYYRPGAAVYEVQGDSMDDGTERAIKEGDLVLVDTSLRDLRPGKLYVLEIIGDGYTLKEARKVGDDWLFISWNPAYEVLRPDEVRVVGQVYSISRFREV